MTVQQHRLHHALDQHIKDEVTWGGDVPYRCHIPDPIQISEDEPLDAVVVPQETGTEQTVNSVQYQREEIPIPADLSSGLNTAVSRFLTVAPEPDTESLNDIAVSIVESKDDVLISAEYPLVQDNEVFDDITDAIAETTPLEVEGEQIEEVRCDLHGYNEYSPPGVDDTFSNCYDVFVIGHPPEENPEMTGLTESTYLEIWGDSDEEIQFDPEGDRFWGFAMAPIPGADGVLNHTVTETIESKIKAPESWDRRPLECIMTSEEFVLPVLLTASISDIQDAWDDYRETAMM